jgi:ribosomal protein L40E
MRAGTGSVCEKCGPRPEPDAEFCSNCGAALLS